MKKYILIFALAFLCIPVMAQEENDATYVKKGDLIEATFYYENGMISQHGFYDLEGKLQGVWTTFDKAGKRLAVGQYEAGKKVGKWFFWSEKSLKEVDYEDHRVASVVEWSNGTKIAVRD